MDWTKKMKRYLIIILIGSLSGLFLRFLLQAELEQPITSLPDSLYWSVLGIILAGVAYLISNQLDRYLGWDRLPGRRWLAGWMLNSLVLVVVAYFGAEWYARWFLPERLSAAQEIALHLKGGVILAFLILAYTVVYFAIHSYRFFGQLRLQKVREERQRMDLQWQGLRAQLQPHFLFNSLNTISALLGEDSERAEAFIRRLAHTYRFMLSSYEESLISLQREIKFVEAYFYLLQTRYPESLKLELDIVAVAKSKKVPPLAIQLLVENAVKHNHFRPDHPLVIRISCDEDALWVQNDLRPKTNDTTSSFAVGLANLKARYRLLQAPEPEVRSSNLFTVKIPLLS